MEVSMLLVLVDGFRMASLDPNENNMEILQGNVRGRGDVQRSVELGKQEPLRLCWITRQEQLNHPSIYPAVVASSKLSSRSSLYILTSTIISDSSYIYVIYSQSVIVLRSLLSIIII